MRQHAEQTQRKINTAMPLTIAANLLLLRPEQRNGAVIIQCVQPLTQKSQCLPAHIKADVFRRALTQGRKIASAAATIIKDASVFRQQSTNPAHNGSIGSRITPVIMTTGEVVAVLLDIVLQRRHDTPRPYPDDSIGTDGNAAQVLLHETPPQGIADALQQRPIDLLAQFRAPRGDTEAVGLIAKHLRLHINAPFIGRQSAQVGQLGPVTEYSIHLTVLEQTHGLPPAGSRDTLVLFISPGIGL